MKKTNKGIFASMIITLAMYVFVIAVVLLFFYFFKYHITMQMWDEYRWNKVQEIPLSLLSMDIDGEPFVARVNKAYYGSLDKKLDELNKIDDIISEQLLSQEGYIFNAVINITGMRIQASSEGCGCNNCLSSGGSKQCWCSGGCIREGKDCYVGTAGSNPPDSSHNWCRGLTPIIGTRYYSAKFPFPLTFNGTDDFTTEISYDVVEITG